MKDANGQSLAYVQGGRARTAGGTSNHEDLGVREGVIRRWHFLLIAQQKFEFLEGNERLIESFVDHAEPVSRVETSDAAESLA